MGYVGKIVCCKCHGLGRRMNAGIFLDNESKLGTTVTCEICNGSGYTNKLFAVEFQFNQKSERYRLPILIFADDWGTSVTIAERVKNKINACFQHVSHTEPVRIFSKPKKKKRDYLMLFPANRRYKFYLLNMESGAINKPEGNPAIRINKHLMFGATNTALIPLTIENAAKENIYPVRVIKGDASFDIEEHLVIKRRMRREKWILNRMLNNDWI